MKSRVLFAVVFCVPALLAPGVAAGRVDALGDPLPKGAVQRLGTERMRYAYGIHGADYGCDSATALVGYGRTIQVWDLKEGRRLYVRQLSRDSGEVRLITGHPREPLALAADASGTVFEWDYRKRCVVHAWPTGRRQLCSLRYSPDGQRVLTLDRATSVIEEWDKTSGRRLARLDPGERKFNCAIYGPAGRTAFVGSFDYLGNCPNVFHFDLRTGKLLEGLLPGGYVGVYALDLAPDGERLLVRLRYAPTAEIRLPDYKLLARGFLAPGRPGPSACYPGDKRWLLTGSRDGTVRVWDRKTGKVVRKWAPHRGWVRSIRVSPDGRWALSYGDGHLLADVNIATGKPRLAWSRHTSGVRAVACSPDGRYVVTGSDDRTIRIWDASTGRGLRSIAADAGVVGVAVSPDGRRVLAGLRNGQVREYALATGVLVHTLQGHSGYVHAVGYLDEARAVSAADDGTLRVWDLPAERAMHVLKGHLGGILALAVCPDRNRVLTAGRDCTIREWAPSTGRLLHSVVAHRGEVWAVACRPDGRRIASGCRNGEIVIWDPATWTPVRVHRGRVRVNSLRYVRGGAALVVGRADGKVAVFDPDTGRSLGVFTGHRGGVNAVAAAPDAHRIVSASDDTTALVWDLTSLPEAAGR